LPRGEKGVWGQEGERHHIGDGIAVGANLCITVVAVILVVTALAATVTMLGLSSARKRKSVEGGPGRTWKCLSCGKSGWRCCRKRRSIPKDFASVCGSELMPAGENGLCTHCYSVYLLKRQALDRAHGKEKGKLRPTSGPLGTINGSTALRRARARIHSTSRPLSGGSWRRASCRPSSLLTPTCPTTTT